MDYLAIIRKRKEEESRHIFKEAKKEVQGEISELSELSPWLGDGEEGCSIVMDRLARKQQDERNELHEKSQASDVVIEPAAAHARPIFWERMSTGAILGPAQPEFLAVEGHGLQASYWVVVTYQGAPVWINADSLRSKRQFEAQGSLTPMPPLAPVPPVKPKPAAVDQPSLEFPDGR